MRNRFTFTPAVLIGCSALFAVQSVTAAEISGRILDHAGRPSGNVTIAVQNENDGALVRSVTSNASGDFIARDLPAGRYVLAYGYAGDTKTVQIADAAGQANVGDLALSEGQTIVLQKLQVSAERQAFYNSIDRKTYDVGKDIASVTGTAGDLLQNIPSVQVDVEGEVSLRGDQNVTILVNGRSSAQMNSNQAEALEQLSSDRIERIEVITNPSSKYRPDGTGGIINIILKDGEVRRVRLALPAAGAASV